MPQLFIDHHLVYLGSLPHASLATVIFCILCFCPYHPRLRWTVLVGDGDQERVFYAMHLLVEHY